jgi:hypothetical protein
MASSAEKLKNNKSIAILDKAEKEGYGIVSVVCVSSIVLFIDFPSLSSSRTFISSFPGF